MTVRRILILDGGMGTTLEAQGHDVSSAMWGLELLELDPEAISAVHAGYVEAGADFIETATYQLTTDLLVQHRGHTVDSASAVSRSAVHLAHQACSSSSRTPAPSVVLSLGPYGAILAPGQEYSGFYPPPYGPRGFVTHGENTHSFADPKDEEQAEEALTVFHLDRLMVYAKSRECWERIAWIAFETIPLLREMRAIRRAVRRLRVELRELYDVTMSPDDPVNGIKSEREWWDKPFWIASAYPAGRIGQTDSKQGPITVSTVVETLLDPSNELAIPSGIGINCTNPGYLSDIVRDLTLAIQPRRHESPPWLVIYPDGGAVYDVHTRTWSSESIAPSVWAEQLMSVVRDAGEMWQGTIVGGCCKSSFADIRALRAVVDSSLMNA